jgi:hypothetical protein
MDDSLRLIQHLYGEDEGDSAFARRLEKDASLRREYEQLSDVKDALDRRPSASPDPEVVDRVVDRAREAAQDPASPEASDRSPEAPPRTRRRRLQGAGAALMVLLALGLGWWQLAPTGGPSAQSGTTARSRAAPATGGAVQRTDEMPAWDDQDEVVRLHRRIEMLRSRSRPDDWGSDLQSIDRSAP